MGKKSRSKRQKKRRYTSTLDQHKRDGAILRPPFLDPGLKLSFSSWANERLPEMLWAALIVTNVPRVQALDLFRKMADFVFALPEDKKFPYVTHTAIAQLPEEVATKLIAVIAEDPMFASALRPLLLLEKLPARHLWNAALTDGDEECLWTDLGAAVLACYDHQSQEATDCRWLKMLIRLVSGYLSLPSEESIREITEYPSFGDMRKVRPTIRAGEMAFATDDPKSSWPSDFWNECFEKTGCRGLAEYEEAAKTSEDPEASEKVNQNEQSEASASAAKRSLSEAQQALVNRIERIEEVYASLASHAVSTAATTGVDPRHDAIFGTGLYALALFHEITAHVLGKRVLGRVGLRVLTECYVNLAYLIKRDDPVLWKSFRVYGAGQAKLTMLKFEESATRPESIDFKVLEQLSNEDAWQEFVPIDLGHWEKSNLRSMSEIAGVKDSYDSYYSWPSHYAHGHWGAIRDAVFDTCVNSLHRFHRIPRRVPRLLPNVGNDASVVVDKILDLIAQQYPGFDARIGEG